MIRRVLYRLELTDKVPNEHTTVAGLSLECYAASLSFVALANVAHSLFDKYCSLRYALRSSIASTSFPASAPPREGLLALADADADASRAVHCNAENESSTDTDSPALQIQVQVRAPVEPNTALFLVMYRSMHSHLLKCIALLFNSEYAYSAYEYSLREYSYSCKPIRVHIVLTRNMYSYVVLYI